MTSVFTLAAVINSLIWSLQMTAFTKGDTGISVRWNSEQPLCPHLNLNNYRFFAWFITVILTGDALIAILDSIRAKLIHT